MIGAYCSLVHFHRHMRPVIEELTGRGHEVQTWSRQGDFAPFYRPSYREAADLIVVASWDDAQLFRDRRTVYVEHGSGQRYCLAMGTRVLRGDLSWVPVDELALHDELIAFDEDRGNGRVGRAWRPATVTGLQVLNLPCYRLVFADGSKITASADHRWLTANRQTYEWQRTSDLQEARVYPKHAAKVWKLFEPWEEDRSWGAGYLAAAFDGEGCLTQTYRPDRESNRLMLAFSQKDNDMLALVEQELDRRGFQYTVSPPTTSSACYLGVRGGCPEILRFLGSIRPRRLLAKFVPPEHSKVRGWAVPLLEKEFIGPQPVVAVETSTGTFVAEGFASHNCGVQEQGYAGAPGLDHVVLFLAPREDVADRWRARYPDAAVTTVGCPALDRHGKETLPDFPSDQRDEARDPGPMSTTSGITVVFTWRWRCFVCEETRPALPHYEPVLEAVCVRLRADGVEVVGHAHPRGQPRARLLWERLGIPYEPDPDAVLERASLLVADSTSLQYEAAALGVPSLALNAPWYRRDVHHGLRFWEVVPGLQCDEPEDLYDSIVLALADPSDALVLRTRAAAYVYDRVDGRAAERAADAIEEVL